MGVVWKFFFFLFFFFVVFFFFLEGGIRKICGKLGGERKLLRFNEKSFYLLPSPSKKSPKPVKLNLIPASGFMKKRPLGTLIFLEISPISPFVFSFIWITWKKNQRPFSNYFWRIMQTRKNIISEGIIFNYFSALCSIIYCQKSKTE